MAPPPKAEKLKKPVGLMSIHWESNYGESMCDMLLESVVSIGSI